MGGDRVRTRTEADRERGSDRPLHAPRARHAGRAGAAGESDGGRPARLLHPRHVKGGAHRHRTAGVPSAGDGHAADGRGEWGGAGWRWAW